MASAPGQGGAVWGWLLSTLRSEPELWAPGEWKVVQDAVVEGEEK